MRGVLGRPQSGVPWRDRRLSAGAGHRRDDGDLLGQFYSGPHRFDIEMQEAAFSFPTGHIEEVAALVLAAARARNGWRVIHEASVIHEIRRHVKTVGR